MPALCLSGDVMTPVYFDYAATTPVDPRVAAVMTACLTMDGTFGNPASRSHRFGWQAEQVVEKARRQLADLLAADPREIVWTSGATESNNLALKGVVEALRNKEPERSLHIITSVIEHKAILDTCAWLLQQGVHVTYVCPDADGLIHPQQVADAPPVRPKPQTQDELLGLFSADTVGRNVVLEPATVRDMVGRDDVVRPSLEVVYDPQ